MARLNLTLILVAVAIILLTPFSYSSIVKAEAPTVSMATTHVESGNTTCDYPDLYGKQKTCLPVIHQGRLVGTSGPTICHKDSCESDIGGWTPIRNQTCAPYDGLLQKQNLQKENKLLFPKSLFPQSGAYKAGWAAGFLRQPFEGHHTQDYIYGYLNGTTLYVYNYNDTGGGHNLDWYIGFHNGAAVADDQYQNGGNFNGSGGCYGGYGKEYCDGYRAGYDTDANALG